jgi:CBS domain-containing protein
MWLKDVMTHGAVTCRADETLERATRLMWENDIGFLPVVDRSDRLIGVITDRDILMAVYTRGIPLCGLLVESTMARSPVTCTIHDDPLAVERRMAKHQVRRLPVVEGGKAIGVVTLSDLARASIRSHDLSSRSPTWALVEITRPRIGAS